MTTFTSDPFARHGNGPWLVWPLKAKSPAAPLGQADIPKGCNLTCYSDRLWQQNPAVHDELCLMHFGDKGQHWGGRSPEEIEAFLSRYLGTPVKLLAIWEGKNAASGFPYWVFFGKKTKKRRSDAGKTATPRRIRRARIT